MSFCTHVRVKNKKTAVSQCRKHSRQPSLISLNGALNLAKTSCANVLALEFSEIVVVAAEVAVRVVLDEDELLAVNVYFDRIGATDFHLSADLLGNNNSAELVNVSDYTG